MTVALMHSKKVFLAIALLVVLTLCSIAVVYAEVTVDSMTSLKGAITYSPDNAKFGTWNNTLAPNSPSAPWYARLEINNNSYIGTVTVTWILQQETGFASWIDVPGATMSTSIKLSGSVQSIYATSNGAYGQSNYDWGQDVTTSGIYRVVATVTT